LTSITGFGFPFKAVKPGIILGVLSLVVLALSIPARYTFHMAGKWRAVYAITAVVALYSNCFVLVAQTFQKEILHTKEPPSGPAFAITQGIVLVSFVFLGIRAVKGFHPDQTAIARSA
jgi:hypothetical protein